MKTCEFAYAVSVVRTNIAKFQANRPRVEVAWYARSKSVMARMSLVEDTLPQACSC